MRENKFDILYFDIILLMTFLPIWRMQKPCSDTGFGSDGIIFQSVDNKIAFKILTKHNNGHTIFISIPCSALAK